MLIFEKNMNEISESTNPKHAGEGIARGGCIILPYIALISFFEFLFREILERIKSIKTLQHHKLLHKLVTRRI